MEQQTKPIFKSSTENLMQPSSILKAKPKLQTAIPNTDIDIRQCIQKITKKMESSKVQTFHPPYFQKTLTKFRSQIYRSKFKPITQQSNQEQSSQKFRQSLQKLAKFIENFDKQCIDGYCQQIRELYIRKIFNDGYQIGKVNFQKLNSQYQLRKQIEQVLNQTSQWLIQLETLEDLLDRVELYFGVKTDSILERLKNDGTDSLKGSWTDYFTSLFKKFTSYVLRKGSKVAQNTGYTTLLTPAFAMLTWALVGGTSTLPWKGGFDFRSFLIPIMALSVPYVLDSMAQQLERSDFKSMLQNWAEQFQKINGSIRHFNEMIQKQIDCCCLSATKEKFMIHYTNLQKFVFNLSKQIQKVSNYDSQSFEEMREATNAYFFKYIEIEEGEWTVVLTPQQYEKYHKNEDKNTK